MWMFPHGHSPVFTQTNTSFHTSDHLVHMRLFSHGRVSVSTRGWSVLERVGQVHRRPIGHEGTLLVNSICEAMVAAEFPPKELPAALKKPTSVPTVPPPRQHVGAEGRVQQGGRGRRGRVHNGGQWGGRGRGYGRGHGGHMDGARCVDAVCVYSCRRCAVRGQCYVRSCTRYTEQCTVCWSCACVSLSMVRGARTVWFQQLHSAAGGLGCHVFPSLVALWVDRGRLIGRSHCMYLRPLCTQGTFRCHCV